MATFGVPSSPGVTKGTAADTIAVPYNDEDAVRDVMEREGDHIAAVIVEPVAGNMGLVLPRQGYLSLLRELTEHAVRSWSRFRPRVPSSRRAHSRAIRLP